MRIYYILLFVLFSLFIINEGFSQSSFYNEYGKNRIQNKSFDWKILSSENFDIYYNNEGKINQTPQNNTYGGGPIEFFSLLKKWRSKGDLRGLEFSNK